ncbi:hypothetical protein AB9E46_08775 [Escherichia coli]|uniref:DUF6979 family protein n=1 Tax=Escherichia coli TaxID=562 RepID=UPI000CF117CF|nr:hypothetical protein [Escherichia coli]EFN6744817.1 hypothetical protein [Escherichia coli O6]AZU83437.1 hypothetical protein EM854_01705 [Escherichia coli]EEW3681536.1 hypothetical protein [Escherichia coli]EEZ5209722.1 hypothetical protein [Escherichia coli]EFB8903323.1 hypothetical protein [Escherichia coli]
MSQYAHVALIAYHLVADSSMTPRDAWDAAVAEVTESESSRKKICPRTTFLALADSGYLKNVKPLHGEKKGGKLYQRAIEVANLILDLPGISKAELVDKTGYKDRQGSYDLILALYHHEQLQRPE